ncbi:MAG: hypothetical protein KDD65_04340 [Bacteroidetes bacterium]|nr:hypothetical protein [Bacteroidota bacterium]
MEIASPDLTRLLRAVSSGEEGAFDALLPHVYGELKQIASKRLRRAIL